MARSEQPLTLAQVSVGDELPARTIHVDRATLVHYAGASGDRNPIHWDERFATGVGLPDVIAHGMWTMGAVVGVVTDWVGDPGRVVEYGTRFTKPVVVPHDGGADVEVTGTVKSVDEDTRRAVVALTVRADEDKVLGRTDVTVQLA
ncbi:MaoC family dehydratase [Janibacter alkaliphilus]|uniref:Acyl dehydratase n=1 Tax=Janibacter alkaliphilus TaxID=1069963 RepID=A0A852X3X3_9MICO|nr:MaoC family dehydratase [Janibacter alkaliphilus]NYG37167.1 acyl dehydratase [Janibacter alkaliphilus]